MSIRILNVKDAEDYRALRLRGLQTEPEAFGATYEQEVGLPLEHFENRLESSDAGFVIGGFEEDQLVCIATFVRKGGAKSSHKGSLQAMYCDEDFRGKGIARDVVNFLLNKVSDIEGVEQLALEVVTENTRAKAFYESFGFEIYGTEPRAMFDGEKYYDEHKMMLDIR